VNGPLGTPDDDALLAELSDVLAGRMGSPPPEVVAGAKALFTWRTVDAELAVLTYDSLLDAEPAGVRADADPPRVLTFEARGLTVELEVESEARGRRLSGQLVPAGPAAVEVRTDGAVHRAEADAFGRFAVRLPEREGRVEVRVRRSPDGVVTAVLAVL
jgi:hypothetical protein